MSPTNLLSSLHNLTVNHPELLPNAPTSHSFESSASSPTTQLQDLLTTLTQVSHTLSTYAANPPTNQKHISQLRQHAGIQHTINQTDHSVQRLVSALRSRHGIQYGEDVPFDRDALVDWCIARIEAWGKSVGMEMFKEEERAGKTTVVLGGKVLVVDIYFDVQRPRIDVASVKTSYAVPETVSNAEGSPSLDVFLKWSIQAFLDEVQREAVDRLEAERLGKFVLEQLRYLMMLDGFATGSEGVKWFSAVDTLEEMAMEVAKAEAEVIAKSLGQTQVPLDIFLQRAHALPIAYLNSPTTSFLTYLSPQAYLSLLRSSSISSTTPIDIPLSNLKAYFTTHPPPLGVTIATLSLSHFPSSDTLPQVPSARPTFSTPIPEHSFLQIPENSTNTWTLTFSPGVVVSQGRMRDIEGLGVGVSVGMFNESWVDLLLKPGSDRYAAIYRSPSNAHPPLGLHLIPPDEPGFVLEKVRVKTMLEVWGVLEVVREQCWLNEVLNGVKWGVVEEENKMESEDQATEEELLALLAGTYEPRKIPVNLYIPTYTSPSIILTMPEKPPGMGMVEVVVEYDEGRSRGVRIQVASSGGGEGRMEEVVVEVEEMCRRGGVFGVLGRLWARGGKP